MQRIVRLFWACLLVGVAAGAWAQTATVTLKPTQGNNVQGTVRFREQKGKTRVMAQISGLSPGKHGFHIHEKGDCSAPDASSAGGHFNPGSAQHGSPDAAQHHAGDLGNVEADAKGRARLDRTVDFLTVSDGPNSVAGKAVIVHAQPDDLQTQPTGNAGGRQACGVIPKK